jgi:hypothetical protein
MELYTYYIAESEIRCGGEVYVTWKHTIDMERNRSIIMFLFLIYRYAEAKRWERRRYQSRPLGESGRATSCNPALSAAWA